jgi:putative heme iron utilization protein
MSCITDPVAASAACATADQAGAVEEFYAANPGMLPVIAAQRLKLAEAVVTSALGANRAVSAPGSAFADVWAVMTGWEQANFLIMKGANVFEILSGVSPGAPSETSQYFNLEYEHPLRGHLRPDLYGSIYAVALPGADDVVLRGVMFFDRDGALVFGTFISGEALTPSDSDLARFNDIWELIEANPSVCAGS